MSGRETLKRYDTGKLSGARTERGYNQTTASGLPFWSLSPEPIDIRITDIAAQLARECRFNGALRHDIEIYSVAQHSCLVSDHCPPELRFEGLLHDAHEAYIGDLIKPNKLNLEIICNGLNPWKALEGRVEAAIRCRFGLPDKMSVEVKKQDFLAVATEHRDVQVVTGLVDWGELPDPWPEPIRPWGVFQARDEFLRRFKVLCPPALLAGCTDLFNMGD